MAESEQPVCRYAATSHTQVKPPQSQSCCIILRFFVERLIIDENGQISITCLGLEFAARLARLQEHGKLHLCPLSVFDKYLQRLYHLIEEIMNEFVAKVERLRFPSMIARSCSKTGNKENPPT
jgi:hypothetical protein